MYALSVLRRVPRAGSLTRALSAATSPRRQTTDFMGADLRVNSPSTKLLIDTSILNIVTRNDDATTHLTEAVSQDPDCGLAWALLGFEYFRNTTPNLKTKHVLTCLDRLEHLLEDGKLSDRETSFGAALLAYVEGHYVTAAATLDAVVEDYEFDLIAMRLAQDCYLQGGESDSALKCVAKRMNLYHDTHEMHGHVLGMLATGYLESGKYTEAEEVGQNAVMATRGTDTNAVLAVLSSIHMSFKSMNLSREIQDYAANNSGPGRHPFSFIEGNYQLHQGNFNGALESFDMLLERCSDVSTRFLTSLVYATMLLMQIDLQVQHLAVDSRWERLGGFWETMPLGKGNIYASPLTEFCSAMTFSRIMKRRVARGDQKLPPAVSDMKLTGIFSLFAPKKQNLEYDQILATEKWEQWIQDDSFKTDSSSSNTGPSWRDHVSKNYKTLRKGGSLPLVYPPLMPDLPVDYYTRSQKDVAMTTVVLPLVHAMDDFSSEQYEQCARTITTLEPVLYRLGGTNALRHSLQSAHIESFLRAGMYKETRNMLNERVTLFEYDAQSWFQLSSVAVHLEEDELGKMAYMRAWQFGHRRVGSEGPLNRR